MKIGVISQARMGSSRLPGKVAKTIGGKTVLDHHIDRLVEAGLNLIVATTVEDDDAKIVEICKKKAIPVFRGSEDNVLDRYYQTAKEHGLDIIARVTSDCPLIDGEILKVALDTFAREYSNRPVYFSNCLERTYPRGFDFEIFSFNELEQAYREARDQVDLEHVTPYIRLKIPNIELAHFTREEDDSEYRITLDTQEDFELIQTLIEKFNAHQLSAEEIIKVMRENPGLKQINQEVVQKTK